MKRKSALPILLIGFISLAFGITADSGLTTVTLQVVDRAGAVVSGASLYVRSNEKNTPLCDGDFYGNTNGAGKASTKLRPGVYDMFVSAPKFIPYAKQVEVVVGKDASYEITLTVSEGHGDWVQ